MTSKNCVRCAEDIDEAVLSYAEIKMLATGNPHIKEKMDLDIQVSKLRLLKQSFLNNRYALEDKLIKHFPKETQRLSELLNGVEKDIETAAKTYSKEFTGMEIFGATWQEKSSAGKALLEVCKRVDSKEILEIGSYRSFKMKLSFDVFEREFNLTLKGEASHTVTLGQDALGNITRIENLLAGLPKRRETIINQIQELKEQIAIAEVEVKKEFPQETELQEKSRRLDELNIMLDMGRKDTVIFDEKPEEPNGRKAERER